MISHSFHEKLISVHRNRLKFTLAGMIQFPRQLYHSRRTHNLLMYGREPVALDVSAQSRIANSETRVGVKHRGCLGR